MQVGANRCLLASLNLFYTKFLSKNPEVSKRPYIHLDKVDFGKLSKLSN